ncbi:hypothetical protein AC249_AIPGENE20069 [Exaiptasia diaphana]|nr:hypothetical protein AC249_AIPGENE20069 [Exaiptasia diaphana]
MYTYIILLFTAHILLCQCRSQNVRVGRSENPLFTHRTSGTSPYDEETFQDYYAINSADAPSFDDALKRSVGSSNVLAKIYGGDRRGLKDSSFSSSEEFTKEKPNRK